MEVAMSKWCLLCGSEYVAGVLECADCFVPLSDRRPLSLDELGSEDETQIVYEFEELEAMQRLAIDERFWSSGVPHAWDGSSLVVREEDEEAADRLIDEADDEAFLASDSEQVAYELEDWDEARRGELTDALHAAAIEHAWDENGDLIVFAHDEDRVDALVDAIDYPDQLEIDENVEQAEDEAEQQLAAQGLDPQDVLSELFVASDRLMHDPFDHEGVLSLVDAAKLAETLPLPYGFAPAVWKDLVGQARKLREALEGDADDETIIDESRSLRTTLRQYV